MPILAFSRDAVASFISVVRFVSCIFKALLPSQLKYCVTGYSRSYQKFHSDPAMTRGRYISEGYLYFLSHYSRSYQKLFSENFTDDPAQITYLTHAAIQGFSWGETQFLRRKLPNFHHLYCRAVLGSYSFNLPLKTSYLNLIHVYKMASILKEALTSHHANMTSNE